MEAREKFLSVMWIEPVCWFINRLCKLVLCVCVCVCVFFFFFFFGLKKIMCFLRRVKAEK